MCGSMADIQSAAAEIRRGNKRRRRRRRRTNHSMKIYMVSLLHRATIMRPACCWALRTIKEICLSNCKLLSTITPRSWTSDAVFKRCLCPHNMVNFGSLAAEIGSGVWGTLRISTGFASWQRYCTALQQWASAELCGVEQRAPPIFGRATITLGIGPHSSWICVKILMALIFWIAINPWRVN